MSASSEAGSPATLLTAAVLRSAPEPARDWLERGIVRLRAGEGKAALGAVYAGAGRRLRGTATSLTNAEAENLESAGLRLQKDTPLDEAARMAFVFLAVEAAGASDRVELVDYLFRTGDNEERVAALRTLAALPDPPSYMTTAREACRTNVVSVFEAIACENPYPAGYFSEDGFNQLVVKALFLGVSVSRIEGLASRCNDELVRMVSDYADERRAAGRTVPDDIALVVSMR